MVNTKSNYILHQGRSSLCGPAAFMYVVYREDPQLFVQAAIDLYNTGKAKIGSLKLYSSKIAQKYPVVDKRMHNLDWMLLSSVKHNYDTPRDEVAGITWPSDLVRWFKSTGYSDVEKRAHLSLQDFRHLVQAQTAYNSGYNVCLLVFGDIFRSFTIKNGLPKHGFPTHWVVLNAPIQIREYNPVTKSYSPPKLLTGALVKTLMKEIEDKTENATDEYGDTVEDIVVKDQIIINAFTWGKNQSAAHSRISATHSIQLDYFLQGYFGFVKAKR